jgi:hypothetical protein
VPNETPQQQLQPLHPEPHHGPQQVEERVSTEHKVHILTRSHSFSGLKQFQLRQDLADFFHAHDQHNLDEHIGKQRMIDREVRPVVTEEYSGPVVPLALSPKSFTAHEEPRPVIQTSETEYNVRCTMR